MREISQWFSAARAARGASPTGQPIDLFSFFHHAESSVLGVQRRARVRDGGRSHGVSDGLPFRTGRKAPFRLPSRLRKRNYSFGSRMEPAIARSEIGATANRVFLSREGVELMGAGSILE